VGTWKVIKQIKENGNLRLIIHGKAVEALTLIECQLLPQKSEGAHIANVSKEYST
jgi:hypothetical protein